MDSVGREGGELGAVDRPVNNPDVERTGGGGYAAITGELILGLLDIDSEAARGGSGGGTADGEL